MGFGKVLKSRAVNIKKSTLKKKNITKYFKDTQEHIFILTEKPFLLPFLSSQVLLTRTDTVIFNDTPDHSKFQPREG